LPDEIEQRLRPEAVDKHGLMMRKHLHVEEVSFRRQRDEEIERGARKTGDRRKIDRLKDIGDEFVGRSVLLENRPNRQDVVLLAEDIGRRKKALEIAPLQLARPADGNPSAHERKRRRQACPNSGHSVLPAAKLAALERAAIGLKGWPAAGPRAAVACGSRVA